MGDGVVDTATLTGARMLVGAASLVWGPSLGCRSDLVLLFVVLVYVYPLKFLYAAVFSPSLATLRPGQAPQLLVGYGAGFAAVFTLLTLLYLHAHRSRLPMSLSGLQFYEARAAVMLYASIAGIGASSALIALALPDQGSIAGFVYFLIAPPSVVAGTLVGRRRRLEARAPRP